VPANVTGSATIGGAPVTLTTTTPGQNATLNFTTTGAQTVTITYDVNSCCPATFQVYQGATLKQTYSGVIFGDINTFNAPAAGSYSLVMDPTYTNYGALTITLS
jgi:large repetitive protein